MQRVVVLDPGHGGKFPGALGPAGTVESRVALRLCLLVASELTASGVKVLLTRTRDRELAETRAADLQARCDFANTAGADLVVSIHANAAEDPAGAGFEVWTSPGTTAADAAASLVWQRVRERLPDRRGRVDLSDGDVDKESKFRLLVGTEGPAVLFEAAFVSNPEEERLLNDAVFLHAVAGAVAEGILEFLDARR